jgi:predicted nucleotide-binding protein
MSNDYATEIRKAKKRFYEVQSDLLSSKHHNFGNNLKTFVEFCDANPIMKKITEPLKNNSHIDINKWWEDFQKTGSSFVGSKRYYLPTDPKEAASLLYKFVLGVERGDFNFLNFALNVYGNHQIDQTVFEFNSDISKKLLRELNNELDEMENMAKPAPLTLKRISIASIELDGDKVSVFVVHGRNLVIRDAMFQFLRSIGLKPIEWSQAVNATGKASPYIGEILDKAFSMARAIVVLMTPDDEGKLREKFSSMEEPDFEKELTPQSRLNVIFEAGIAIGRDQDRTVIVEFGRLRPFSDIGGRHVIRMDDSGPKRQELAQRLQTAGCKVDLTGTDWHTCGKFKID